jgi:hypothetical protein
VELTLQTPSLLFPAVSLLLLAYTNRFLGLASLVRSLEGSYRQSREGRLLDQIRNLKRRLRLIRNMQLAGVLSLFCCTVTMFPPTAHAPGSAAVSSQCRPVVQPRNRRADPSAASADSPRAARRSPSSAGASRPGRCSPAHARNPSTSSAGSSARKNTICRHP